MSTSRENSVLDRRRFVALSSLGALGVLAGCDYSAGDGPASSVLKSFQRFNDWMQAAVFDPNKPAPEFAESEVTPEDDFRVNTYDTDTPEIDLENWSLTIEGLVARPGEYTLEQISSLPKHNKNLRHCCVEGWSMVPKWSGALMRDLLAMAGADMSAKYIAVTCGDDYFTAWDMPSALHAQTLLAYEAYGKPLSLEHGAPVRVVMPTKLGYKSAKWIDKITVTNDKPGGYWEDQGYDWFAGL